MRLKLDTSWRRERIEIMLNPGEEIELPDELGTQLERRYAHLVEVKAETKTPRRGRSPQDQAADEAPEPAPEPENVPGPAEAEAETPAKPAARKRRTATKTAKKTAKAKA